jgi:hypothetical protein
MTIKQISVFIENKIGRLAEFTKVLGDQGVDVLALSVADTASYGILRAIVDDNERALKACRDAGYTANLTDVLAVAVSDTPGGLSLVLNKLNDAAITVEYLYSFVRRVGDDAVLIFRVDQLEKAAQTLQEGGVRLLNETVLASV